MGAAPEAIQDVSTLMPLRLALVLALLTAGAPGPTGAETELAAAREVRIVGSGYTMPRFIDPWIEQFREKHPEISVLNEAQRTSMGPPALVSGRAQIASMTRPWNAAEFEAFRRRFGYEPTAIPVAADAVAVYVHEDNPLTSLTLEQLDAVFSRTRLCGAEREAVRWGDLGVDGPLADRSIGLHGRHPGSGTGVFFRRTALCGGVFRESLRVSPGSSSALLSLAESEFGIGFSSRADRIPGVKPLALVRRDGEPATTVAAADVYSGAYPLGRQLFFYVNQPPGRPLGADVRAFVAHALSDQAQAVVERVGYLRVPPERAAQALAGLH